MRLMNREIVIATKNRGKVREFEQLFAPRGIRVKSLNDFADVPDIVEDGATFAANALKKARTIAAAFGLPALADDSGLCVDELGGAPGVYSARYAGLGATDRDNNAKLLAELAKREAEKARSGEAVPPAQPNAAPHPGAGPASERHAPAASPAAAEPAVTPAGTAPRLLSRARFVCALALYEPAGGRAVEVEGSCDGYIIAEPRGEGGFGYDPLFYLPELGLTMAELPVARKNELSHRARALQALLKRLEQP